MKYIAKALSFMRTDQRPKLRVDESDRGGAKSRVNRQIDFLVEDFANTTAERIGNTFNVKAPWTLIDFGVARLSRGWWRLDCETTAPPEGVEVRLRSGPDPLIVFNAADSAADRIFLRAQTGYQISLLISPWPVRIAFSRLQLTRLTWLEAAELLGRGLVRVLGREKPLARIATIYKRLIAGQSFGVTLSSRNRLSEVSADSQATLGSSSARRTEFHGDIVAGINENDKLDPRALAIARTAFELDPLLMAIYGDRIVDGRLRMCTGWDRLQSEADAYSDAPVIVRAACPTSLHEVAAAYGDRTIRHVPLPLSSGPEVVRRATVRPEVPSMSWREISVVIPTKLRVDLLANCLKSLKEKTDYPALEVVIVDNGVHDPRFREILATAANHFRLKVVKDSGNFNFSRLVNAGAAVCEGEGLLILNDDVQAMDESWLQRMSLSAFDSKAGAVGARLIYPDSSVQHAGVTLGIGGPCGHLWKGLAQSQAEANTHIAFPGRRMAVTGACMLVRRETFVAVDGFDEALAVAFNDVDFCLRLHARGLANIYRGDAVLIHHESKSRGLDDANVARRRRLARETDTFLSRWGHLIQSDAYGSQAFDPAIEQGVPHRSLLAEIRRQRHVRRE